MRSHFSSAFVALVVTFLIQALAASPGFGQGTGTDGVHMQEEDVHFQVQAPFQEYLGNHPPQVEKEWAFDLCGRGATGRGAPATKLDPSKSPCGDAFNPSSTVTGGHPPYHFQLEPMGGFPPMGMWVDMNGVLRGKPSKNAKGASFSVCAVDMGGRSDCQQIDMPAPQAGGVNPALLAVGAGAGIAAGIYAGSALGDLATTAGGGVCISSRSCIVNTLSSGCSCSGSTSGNCGYTGPTAGTGERCDAGVPCESGLSCNNGRCEGRGGRCPF